MRDIITLTLDCLAVLLIAAGVALAVALWQPWAGGIAGGGVLFAAARAADWVDARQRRGKRGA